MQYKRIVTWLESESALGDEDEQKGKALRLAAHLNLAMCYLKIQEAAQALENCDKVFFTAGDWEGPRGTWVTMQCLWRGIAIPCIW